MYAVAAISIAATKVDTTAFAICRGLSRNAASRIAAIRMPQKMKPGENLFSENDEADSVYEVVTGMLRLYKLLPDGRRQIIGFLGPGQILGLASKGIRTYAVEAVNDVTLCRYPRTGFFRLFDEVPGLARRLLAVASNELRAAQDQMLLLGRKGSAEKVASFLLLLMADQQSAGDEVSVPMSRGDIADYLGLTVETVSRTFTKLKIGGVIALPTANHVEIRDREQLEDFANGQCEPEL